MRPRHSQSCFEPLEPRCLLSTVYLVDSTSSVVDGDYGPGQFTLREAIELANSTTDDDELILFADAVRGRIFEINGPEHDPPIGQLEITRSVRISGYTETGLDALVTIDADFRTRVFDVDDGDPDRASPVILENLTIRLGHSAHDDGGAIRTLEPLTLTDCLIQNSIAGIYGSSGSYATGGGIYAGPGASLHLTRSIIRDCGAQEGAGIYARGIESLIIVDSEVSGNGCTVAGAGVALRDLAGNATIAQSTISTNRAIRDSNGGGLWIDSPGTLITVRSCTIAANGAGADQRPSTGIGGGVYAAGGLLLLQNTLVAGNTRLSWGGVGGVPDDIRIVGDAELSPESSYNLVADAATSGGLTHGAAGNIVGLDPAITALDDHGGPSLTHALLPGSPAIDAGHTDDETTTDQRGLPRPSGVGTDVGAFERQAPTIASLTGSVELLVQGEELTLTAEGIDGEGTISVEFFYDADGLDVGEPPQLLGSEAVDDQLASFLVLTTDDTLGLLPGVGECYVVAVDGDGAESPPARAPLEVLYTLLGADPAAAWADPNAADVTIAIRGLAGDLILFREQGEGWLAERLTALAADGEAAIWTDPRDQIQYAAAATGDGLLLLYRTDDGWSFRNLSNELALADTWRALTQFTGSTGVPHLAAIGDADRIVLLTANESAGTGVWDVADLSAGLASQGMSSPLLESMTGFATPWGALTLAGIDRDGSVRAVWINPSRFSMWRSDNLSAIAGTPAATGQLSVMATAWGAIHLTAVSPGGRMISTWWAPGFGGRWLWSDLSTAASAPELRPGVVVGIESPWGAIHYAGVSTGGEIVAFWWSRDTPRWRAAPISDSFGGELPRPAAALVGHASGAGVISITGVSGAGRLVRLWWSQADPIWHLSDLTAAAGRT